ncbi:MAG: alkaline phosphatase D family protein, partial [Bacteroidota bacterium]
MNRISYYICLIMLASSCQQSGSSGDIWTPTAFLNLPDENLGTALPASEGRNIAEPHEDRGLLYDTESWTAGAERVVDFTKSLQDRWNKIFRGKEEPEEELLPEDFNTYYHSLNLLPTPDFPYGVASGDPLPDGIILWTMVKPEDECESRQVFWELSERPDFKETTRIGVEWASPAHHYRIKLDLRELSPETTYYYRFRLANGAESAIGRTRTSPRPNSASPLRFAIVSCNAFEWGHFNGFGRISEHDDLNAVLHLGDYIYEYASGEYGDLSIGRLHEPRHELITEEDYNQRYAQYRSDLQLAAAHAAHPFICIWDDHEVANDSYTEGAENHDSETEGDYLLRMTSAKQIYYDWMPVRESNSGHLYRSFTWGSVADLHMLDERLAGRTVQASSFSPEDLADPNRQMLGEQQFEWLIGQLEQGESRWQLIGNQVLFARLDLSNALPQHATNVDAWDGYRHEKYRLEDYLNSIDDPKVLFLTGDTHCSWYFDIRHRNNGKLLARELATPSLSSANFDELGGDDGIGNWAAKHTIYRDNPDLIYTDLTHHGYIILEVDL